MKTMRCRGRLAAVLFLLTMAACSGGGGGGAGGGGGEATAAVPTITMQPTAASVPAGGTATFTIAATSNGVLTYQWYANVGACPNCGPLSGATQPTLTLPANYGTTGDYYCVVTNTLNGTQATATSASGSLNVVEPTGNGAINADSAVLANTVGYVASVAAQAGVTYTWTISNGTITAGQGTTQITYTSGGLGQLELTMTASGPAAGTVLGVKNVVVVSSLPVVSIFAQSSVLPGAMGVLASTTDVPAGTYAWTEQNGTAAVTIVGSTTADTLTYSVGATPGSYQVSVNVTDQTGNHGSVSQTLSVVQGAFLKDVRDMAQRSLHTATLLMDGRVLLAGGDAGIPGTISTTSLPVVSSASNIVATAELFDPVTTSFAVVGSLSTARAQHTATLLNNGQVLVAGGLDATGTPLASTEIYNPTTQSWTPGPPMAMARELPSATLLADGRVLVAGGANASGALASAEVYDPVANAWSSAGTMASPRVLHSATLLPSGQVLAVAGFTGSGGQTASTELYNPETNSWHSAAPLPQAPTTIAQEGAVLLASGQVLELGATAYIYNPTSNSWRPSVTPPPAETTPEVTTGFEAASAILLPNGRVLAAGGFADFGSAIYDPIMQQWNSPTSPGNAPSWGFGGEFGTVTALADGRVLAVGGVLGFPTSSANSLSLPAFYDPTQNSWSLGGSEAHPGYYAASGVLTNGQVLVTGGSVLRNSNATLARSNADLFNPATNTWSPAAAMSTTRQQHTATALQNGMLLVTGGNDSSDVFSSAELYNPAANTWSSAGMMSSLRYQHTASLLGNGLVLVAGGNDLIGTCSCTTFVASADLYNPTTNSFSPTGSLVTARYAHTATVLANGMVLVAGGFGGPTSTLESGGAPLASAELYDPSTGTWTATGSMTTARMNHTATLLSSGDVLVAGGYTGTATTATAEVYDPSTGTWSAVASMNTPRQSQGAAALSAGTVLIVGGFNDASSAVIGVGTTEVYDPVANTWALSGSMATTRQFFTLSALGDGRILLDGGSPNASGLPEFYK
jgi:N-acetylneuraminic acid mutarotase